MPRSSGHESRPRHVLGTPTVARGEQRRLRILIVDDHDVVRRGLAAQIGLEPDLEVCGEADSGIVAAQQVETLRPDVVLLDLSLRDSSGLDAIKTLRDRGSEVAILVISAHDEEMYAERCLRAGAQGFVSKSESMTRILEAIRRIGAGGYCVSDRTTAQVVRLVRDKSTAGGNTLAALSDREIQVYEAIAAGLSVKEIAAKFVLSVKTIDTYRAKIKLKLGLASSQQLARHAMQWSFGSASPSIPATADRVEES